MFLASNEEAPFEQHRNIARLDNAFASFGSNFKLLHHLLIARYSKITKHHTDRMFGIVGLDIETDHTTGMPKLLGFSYDDDFYHSIVNPTLNDLYIIVKSLLNNSRGTNVVTWGNLDINGLIRLFDPSQDERKRIASGLGGNWGNNGEWIGEPPVMREMSDGRTFYIDHYIGGRSLRLGIIFKKRAYSIWIYNISQFFETTIAETATALKMGWIDYGEDSHIVKWDKFESNSEYHTLVLESNKQDAEIVRKMAAHLGSVFYSVFKSYPKLLVSTGSLADAAVSTLLNVPDYASNSWRYLTYDTFKDSPFVPLAESLLSEAYSAGYVDQFGIGYFPEAHTADISSAYPHKIGQLPDLRSFRIFSGKGNPEAKYYELESNGWRVFTAVIRGTVTIPEHLKYHPITVKTVSGQNYRPLGTFNAAYYMEERNFCSEWGARFFNEEWVLFATKDWKVSPIAKVVETLDTLRSDFREKMRNATTDEETILFDSMQYMVKVVANSLYGKNVMTVSIVEDIDGKPTVTGLKAGDRYNQLYAGWVTAMTRTQLADACMELEQAGSNPIMAMTDAVYWSGDRNHLPESVIAAKKTAGLFEPPETIKDFFVIKTGQYEYRTGHYWSHKVRGLNIPYKLRPTDSSYFRRVIQEWLKDKSPYMHPEDIEIPVTTRKLVTIGAAHDLEKLGLIEDTTALMKPFVLSGKQTEPFVTQWRKCLDSHVWLPPAIIDETDELDTPLRFVSGLHENGADYLNRYQRKRLFYLLCVKVTGKATLPKRLSHMSYEELEEWSGVKRKWARI